MVGGGADAGRTAATGTRVGGVLQYFKRDSFRVVLYKRMAGWSSKASEAELKGAEDGD